MNSEILKSRIEFLKSAKNIEPILKGYSTDQKYIIHDEENKKYILRVSDIQEYNRKQSEFDILKEMELLNVKSSVAIEIGKVEELNICYQILSYIEGKDARDLLPFYSESDQFQIGVEAGKDLAKIHLFPAPVGFSAWDERQINKHLRYVEAYKESGLKIKNDDKIIHFINENLAYLKNRPNQLQHDDFHVGNILVDSGSYAGIIDYNRYDWGDPIHDFHKIGLFSKEISIPFSIGQIQGYFHQQPIPDHFWRLYSIYMAMNIFSAAVWTHKVVPSELSNMLDRLYEILEDHKYFELIQPTWYKSS